ncbi:MULTISPECIES: FeoA family protein [Acinetobacter]|uniref:Ferrous iron transport protein A n=1 Tax=Acinetobacter pollinis TaxID=2605270 RepID=A0ABU6DSE7_9GAMM|nr:MULTISPECIES: FeoA family protein [Acinetobacter]MBF7690022.1 ferrous iron transport protein A [Acinetobacter pollinis]MBF7692757.1 ferrous iron transport protein A [Acinetobacter pollinis]MBF7697774.1 ferrous iron transport protein A [Acinetobacter pollinis]MBF7700764.1 ferrous iron transport protein A [Acinetobacter pollinis]MEB5476760.1 ferrous iron transport protein A [Acinetobacter pollinis]
MLLSELKVKQAAVIQKINHLNAVDGQDDLIASRLETLGFLPGTLVKIIARGVFGGDPILIQIGFTRFALRKFEAEKIEVNHEGAPV